MPLRQWQSSEEIQQRKYAPKSGNFSFTIRAIPFGMTYARTRDSNTDLSALEATAVTARAGFACMFSTSDEYESALIAARRAEGRYQTPFDWQPVALIGCVFILSGLLLMAL
jgi:hypothetical protein